MRSVWRAIAGGDGLLRTILAPAFSATVNFWPLYEGVKGATLAAVRTVEGAAKAWRSTARARGRKRRAEDIVGPVFSRCLRQSLLRRYGSVGAGVAEEVSLSVSGGVARTIESNWVETGDGGWMEFGCAGTLSALSPTSSLSLEGAGHVKRPLSLKWGRGLAEHSSTPRHCITRQKVNGLEGANPGMGSA